MIRQLIRRRGVNAGHRDEPASPLVAPKWQQLDDLARGGGGHRMEDVLGGTLDGLVLRGILDPRWCRKIVNRLGSSHPEAQPAPYGQMIPFPLNACREDRTPYLESAARAPAWMAEVFDFDVRSWLNDVFERIGDRHADVIHEGTVSYLPGTFRIMDPGRGALHAHTGNEFLEMNRRKGLAEVDRIAHVADGLSFFLLLQKPEHGGDLRIYDLVFDDTDEDLFADGFDANQRDDSRIDSLHHIDVDLAVGDMVVFRGGNIWHKVTELDGSIPRITFGGFIAPTRDDHRHVYWC